MFKKNKTQRYLQFVLVCTVLIFFTQLTFIILQQNQAEQTKASVLGLLGKELSTANPMYLSQTLSDLQSLGLLRCAFLMQTSPSVKIYLDLRFKNENECHPQSPALNGLFQQAKVTAADGTNWETSFVSVNHDAFYGSLWLVRISTIILAFLFFIIFYGRTDHQEKIYTLETKHLRSLNELAVQVAHDIRSPLEVLNTLLFDITDENKKIYGKAIQRINEIANNLLQQKKNYASLDANVIPSAPLQTQAICPLVEEIINEKQIQYQNKQNIKIVFLKKPSDEKVYVQINPTEFTRMLSNIINNAIEALPHAGYVSISLKLIKTNILAKEMVQLEIADNGKGMHETMLSKILQQGGSFGKPNGSGLGLQHAKQMLKDWHGYFSLESQLGLGTRVFITLPLATTIEAVLIDDDELIHLLWKKTAIQKNKIVKVFKSTNDFFNDTIDKQTPIYIDYNLANGKRGDDESKRLFDKGFQNIYLATGLSQTQFNIPWVKGVVNKAPPF